MLFIIRFYRSNLYYYRTLCNISSHWLGTIPSVVAEYIIASTYINIRVIKSNFLSSSKKYLNELFLINWKFLLLVGDFFYKKCSIPDT